MSHQLSSCHSVFIPSGFNPKHKPIHLFFGSLTLIFRSKFYFSLFKLYLFLSGSKFKKLSFLIGSAEFAKFWPSPQVIWKINFYWNMGFMLTLMGLSGSSVIYVYHLFIFAAYVTPPQMVNTFVLFISVEMINIFFFFCFLFLCLLCFCSRMERPKSKKEKEKDGNVPKPVSRESAHKGGDLNQWFEPQMQMAIDEYLQYISFLFICKNVSAHVQELQTVCPRKSTLVNNFFPNETFPS